MSAPFGWSGGGLREMFAVTVKICFLAIVALALAAPPVSAQTPIVVTASRVPNPPSAQTGALSTLNEAELERRQTVLAL